MKAKAMQGIAHCRESPIYDHILHPKQISLIFLINWYLGGILELHPQTLALTSKGGKQAEQL